MSTFTPVQSPVANHQSTKPTILIAEDNPELRSYMQVLLEDAYHVITAENGKVAWELLTASPIPQFPNPPIPDLIISDLMMPFMDGFQWVASEMHLSERQFTRRLKQLTGLTPNNYLREMRLQRARDFLHEGKYTTVKEVGYAVGFSSTEYFSSLFQERFGVSPSEYLKVDNF